MTQANGNVLGNGLGNAAPKTEAAALEADIKALAGQMRQGPKVIEHVHDDGPPFEQKAHSLIMESVDKVAQQWIAELSRVRENTQTLEQMVVSQVTRVKDEITKLHLLGTQTMKEAQRGHEVSQHLADELDAMMAEHRH